MCLKVNTFEQKHFSCEPESPERQHMGLEKSWVRQGAGRQNQVLANKGHRANKGPRHPRMPGSSHHTCLLLRTADLTQPAILSKEEETAHGGNSRRHKSGISMFSSPTSFYQ